jgi:hypothetical protein
LLFPGYQRRQFCLDRDQDLYDSYLEGTPHSILIWHESLASWVRKCMAMLDTLNDFLTITAIPEQSAPPVLPRE